MTKIAVGGHMMLTLLWDAARFVEKSIGSGNMTYKTMSKQQRWETE